MVSVFGPLKRMNAKEFKRGTYVTYLGQVYGTMSALKRMLPRNKGKIILIGSANIIPYYNIYTLFILYVIKSYIKLHNFL